MLLVREISQEIILELLASLSFLRLGDKVVGVCSQVPLDLLAPVCGHI